MAHCNKIAYLSCLPCSKRDSLLFKGDEILAVNNLHVESVEEVKFYLRKLRTNKVKLYHVIKMATAYFLLVCMCVRV